MGFTDVFKSKAAKQADVILAELKQASSGTINNNDNFVADLLSKYDDGVAKSLNDKKSSITDGTLRDAIRILDRAYAAQKCLDEKKDDGFVSAISDILSYRTYEAASDTFALSTQAARTLCNKTNGDNRPLIKAQAEGLEVMGDHFNAYSIAVGSGSAGFGNMSAAVTKYIQAAKAYSYFGKPSNCVEAAKKAENAALRHGVHLNDEAQKFVDYHVRPEQQTRKSSYNI